MCTAFSVRPDRGDSELCYSVRNMDWPIDMESEAWFVPRSQPSPLQALDESGAPRDGYPLKKWAGRYSFFALNGLVKDKKEKQLLQIFNDGLNEKGLSASALFLNEGRFECSPVDDIPGRDNPPPTDRSIDIATLIEYLLGNYATVDALVQDLADETSEFPVVTASRELLAKLLGFPPRPIQVGDRFVYLCPLHFRVCDRSGDNAVLEWVEDGKLRLYHRSFDDPGSPKQPLNGSACNVMTNSPPYPWHLENLRWHAWLGLSDQKYQSVTLPNGRDGYEIKPGADNLGLSGLSADLSSPTRFLRAAALSALTARRFAGEDYFKGETTRINHLFSLAQLVAIPKAYRHDAPEGDSAAAPVLDGRTVWSTVHDHKSAVMYVQSYERKLPLRLDFRNYASQLQAERCCAIDDPELAPYWQEIVPASNESRV